MLPEKSRKFLFIYDWNNFWLVNKVYLWTGILHVLNFARAMNYLACTHLVDINLISIDNYMLYICIINNIYVHITLTKQNVAKWGQFFHACQYTMKDHPTYFCKKLPVGSALPVLALPRQWKWRTPLLPRCMDTIIHLILPKSPVHQQTSPRCVGW